MALIERGSIYAARLDPVEGSEQAGTRPVIVMSNDSFNSVMPILTVVPLTSLSVGRRIYPSEVRLEKNEAGLRAESLALCHQVRTIAASRIGRRIGAVSPTKLANIAGALKTHLDL